MVSHLQHALMYLILSLNVSYWSIVDLQCRVNFCCTAKWSSYTYTYTFFFTFFSIMVYHRILNIVPDTIQASQVELVVKNLPVNSRDLRDTSSLPGWGRSPRGGYGNPLQYSWLENPMDRGAVLYSRILFLIHSVYTRLHLLIPNSRCLPLPSPSSLAMSPFCVSASLFLFHR